MLSAPEKEVLRGVADRSIRDKLFAEKFSINRADFPATLFELGASFVTLNLRAQLRGCIGSLEATRPLLEDIAQNAQAAAFHDPRFAPLTPSEYEGLDIHISVLTKPVAVTVAGEEELLRTLRPGIDGLVIREGHLRATFLPSVWQSLPQPEKFLRQLKLKAGLAENYWSSTLRLQIYTVEEF